MTTNLPAKTPTEAPLSLALSSLVNSETPVEAAASSAIKGGLIEELRGALPALYSAAAIGAGQDGIEAAIRPWFATYPQPGRSDGEWAAFWQGYVIACGHHSEAALHGAMKAWAKLPDSEFLPKPGKLSELAVKAPTAAFKLANRAHNILQIADDMTGRQRVLDNMDRDQVKPEDQIAAVAQLLAEFKAKNEPARDLQDKILRRGVKYASAEKVEELPYIGGECAPGSALTPQMFQAMGWPAPQPRVPNDEPPEFTEAF